EHPRVLGRLRLPHPQVPRQLGHRPLAAPQHHQYLPPLRLGDCVERVRGGRRSWHDAIICLYRNVSTQPAGPHRGLDRVPIFTIRFLSSIARLVHTTTPGESSRPTDRKSTRLNSSHVSISYAV